MLIVDARNFNQYELQNFIQTLEKGGTVSIWYMIQNL